MSFEVDAISFVMIFRFSRTGEKAGERTGEKMGKRRKTEKAEDIPRLLVARGDKRPLASPCPGSAPLDFVTSGAPTASKLAPSALLSPTGFRGRDKGRKPKKAEDIPRLVVNRGDKMPLNSPCSGLAPLDFVTSVASRASRSMPSALLSPTGFRRRGRGRGEGGKTEIVEDVPCFVVDKGVKKLLAATWYLKPAALVALALMSLRLVFGGKEIRSKQERRGRQTMIMEIEKQSFS